MKRLVNILGSEVASDLGFLKITKTRFTYTLPGGLREPNGTEPEQTRLVIDRKNSAAALVRQKSTGLLYFVKQFRFATYNEADEPSEENGWLTELVAGVVESNETSREAISREIGEELGFQDLSSPELIGSFYLSPGAASERLYLYFVEVGDVEPLASTLRRGDGDEWIQPISMTPDDFLERVAKVEIFDAKTVVCAEYVRRRPDLFRSPS